MKINIIVSLILLFCSCTAFGAACTGTDTISGGDSRIFQPCTQNAIPNIFTEVNATATDVWSRYHIDGCASGSVSPLWSGTIPVGLALNTATGRITGTPTVTGAVSSSVTCTNSIGPETNNFTWTITDSALEGYGTISAFGSGGATCDVTNVNDAGAGSLRQCLIDAVNGAGTEITFSTTGTIVLASDISIAKSHITIDASGASTPGITIDGSASAGVNVNAFSDGTGAHDILIRGIRFLAGWDRDTVPATGPAEALLAVDCENNLGSVDSNIVFDRITIIGAKDSGGDIFGRCTGVTMQYSFLLFNYHPQSVTYSTNALTRQKISLHHNIYYSNEERSPQIRGDTQDLEHINNVVGGWGLYSTRIRERDAAPSPNRVNLILNHWLDYTPPLCDTETACTADDAGLQFLDAYDTTRCFSSGNDFVAAETDDCTGASEFARADSTSAPTRHTLAQLPAQLIPTTTTPNVGMPFPSTEEQNVLAEVKAQMIAESGAVGPQFWASVPQSACDIKVNTEGKTCASADVFCPTTLAEIRTDLAATAAGDAVCIRAGTYTCDSAQPCFSIPDTNNGTAIARKAMNNYPREVVVLQGVGGNSEVAWDDITTNLPPQGGNQVGLILNGDFWTIQGFRMEWFGEAASAVGGDFDHFIDMDIQYGFRNGVMVGIGDGSEDGDTLDGFEMLWSRIRNVYHHTGLRISGNVANLSTSNGKVAFNLIGDHGFEADGDQAPGVQGDGGVGGIGGQNSDATGLGKECFDIASVICSNWDIRYNVMYHNADDCYDSNATETTLWGNITYDCAPNNNRGFKHLRSINGATHYISNFSHGKGGTMSTGYELRNNAQEVDVVNGGVVFLDGTGVAYELQLPSSGDFRNNMGFDAGTFSNNLGSTTSSNNHSTGDPEMEDCLAATVFTIGTHMDNNAIDAKQRLFNVYSQFAQKCGPAAGSIMIDAGVVVSGFHCATADDDATTPHDPTDQTCLHWLGTAPDQGAFERGLWD